MAAECRSSLQPATSEKRLAAAGAWSSLPKNNQALRPVAVDRGRGAIVALRASSSATDQALR
jgi:hypothetical protein